MSRRFKLFLGLSLIAGILLRVLFVNDMEYKEDEEFNFVQTQLIGTTQPWPWHGIPSGVYIVNPGMSIWVFTILAKALGIHSPTSLAHAVQGVALLGMFLVLPFARRYLTDTLEKRTWYWAFALAMVNPFLILYQRKLWPEPFLPVFTMLTLMGWWRKETVKGALLWGFVGALIGQVHMSGFFFSAALFLWTALFSATREKVKWRSWFLGSTLGALPLLPWFIYIIQHPVRHAVSSGWDEAIQLKYWVFWLTDSLGLHLGNALGILRGPRHWDQISDFIRYPLIAGHATYFMGFVHAVALGVSLLIFGRGLLSLWNKRTQARSILIGKESSTAFVQNATFWGCGILMTLTGVMIRRYYMAVTFPLEFIFLIRMAGIDTKQGQRLITVLWICELMISAHFVGYIHVNQGSILGDYGQAYHLVKPQFTYPHP